MMGRRRARGRAGSTARGDRNPIDTEALEELSRDELLSLARRLVRRRPAERGGKPRRSRVNAGTVASSVAAALHYEWEPPRYATSREFGVHTDRARRDLKAGRWEEAIRGATGVIRGFAGGYDPGFDEEGMVQYDLHEAVEVVDHALRHVSKPGLRGIVFDALLELWWADAAHGGVGLSEGVPEVLRKHASRSEKDRLASRVKDRLPEARDGFQRREAASLFLDLRGDRLGDEEYVEFCRENGLHIERVERLLGRGRAEEAARAAGDVEHYRLTEAADLLVKAGHPALAVEVVRSRLENPDARAFRDRFKEWLQLRAERGNDVALARQLAWERFREGPSMGTYQSLRKVAVRARSWREDEDEVLSILRRPEHGELLTEVHLAERRGKEALESLKALPKRYPDDWGHEDLKRRVAEAARKDFPEAARDLYLELVDSLISRKTRAWYARAAPLVKAACALDERVRGGRAGSGLIQELRRRYENLPALWDELGKAGVGGRM